MAEDAGAWGGMRFTVREKRLTLGRQYRVLDDGGRLLAFCRQKMFRLREDIRFYASEEEDVELFRLTARKVIDFNANLDVVTAAGERLASLRRKGWRSLVRDKWEVHDADDRLVATLEEDSLLMALVRRLLIEFLPMRYALTGADGRALATIRERFQLFGDTYDLEVRDAGGIDPRVLVGLTVCLDALEGE